MSLTRSLDKARDAFSKRDSSASINAHKNKNPYEKHSATGQYLKSAVYGGLDGTITTFAIVAGVAGASLSASVVLIMGFANLIGDGISMAIGDYLSTKSEKEYHAAERKREEWEVDNYPEGEKKEMLEIYRSKGMNDKDSEKIVSVLSKNKKAWVDVMMVEELGMIEDTSNPLKNAVVTFFSFALFGLIPLLAYLVAHIFKFPTSNLFVVAIILTGVTLFVLGALRSRVTNKNWLTSGLEMLVVGGIAAGAAYLVGYLLHGVL